VSTEQVWLRTPRFDLWLQAGALISIAPALALYAALDRGRASSLLPLASLVAIPFLHVFGSFFYAFSEQRNQSAARPRRLAAQWALWTGAVVALQVLTPRALATFALLYGGWHILRQNFGFLRELAHRAGRAGDRGLRRLDLAACLAPAVALWLWVSARGPWRFITDDVHHLPVPAWLLALAFTAVPALAWLRERHLADRPGADERGRRDTRAAGRLLLAGNAAALLAPALLLDDLLLIYTLSASFHGFQYLVYLAARERERQPDHDPVRVLLPLAATIGRCMLAGLGLALLIGWLCPPGRAEQAIVAAWYAVVPFHYFVDGRIWRRAAKPGVRPETATAVSSQGRVGAGAGV